MTSNDIITSIRKLPEEIRIHILSYSMTPQPDFLCQDIRNFYSTLNHLYDIYYKIYIVDFHEDEPEDKIWIINDLLGYMNGYYPMNQGFVERFYQIIRRSFTYNNVTTVQQFIRYLNTNHDIFRQIHIIWGLLHAEEREYFIHNAFKPGVNDLVEMIYEDGEDYYTDEEYMEEDWDF